MDIVMPDVDGVEAIRQILSETPTARIIALTMYRQERYMLDVIRADARGYLFKTVDAGDLIAAIEAVYRADYLIDPLIAARVLNELRLEMPELPCTKPLTDGEMAVLGLVAQGLDNQDIAQTLNYSVYTVANRLRTIYEKLHDRRTPGTLDMNAQQLSYELLSDTPFGNCLTMMMVRDLGPTPITSFCSNTAPKGMVQIRP